MYKKTKLLSKPIGLPHFSIKVSNSFLSASFSSLYVSQMVAAKILRSLSTSRWISISQTWCHQEIATSSSSRFTSRTACHCIGIISSTGSSIIIIILVFLERCLLVPREILYSANAAGTISPLTAFNFT